MPKDKIIIENKSTNTGENLKFTHEILQRLNINPKTLIVLQKPCILFFFYYYNDRFIM